MVMVIPSKNLVVEGSNTGMIKTLGDGAIFKNIIFEDAQARNFSGANNGIIASTVRGGANVLLKTLL